MDEMVWVYYKGKLDYVVEGLNKMNNLADLYPDAIYFYAGVVLAPLED